MTLFYSPHAASVDNEPGSASGHQQGETACDIAQNDIDTTDLRKRYAPRFRFRLATGVTHLVDQPLDRRRFMTSGLGCRR